MPHTITVTPRGDIWTATFSDPAIKDIMGSATIPTAYLAGTPKEMVIAEIQKRNPEYIVS